MTKQKIPYGGPRDGWPNDLDAPKNGDQAYADFQAAVERAAANLAARGGRFVYPGNAMVSPLKNTVQHIFLLRPRPPYAATIVCRFFYQTGSQFDLVNATFEQLEPASVQSETLEDIASTYADDIKTANQGEIFLPWGGGAPSDYDDQLHAFRLTLTAVNDTVSVDPTVRLVSCYCQVNPASEVTL